MRNLSWRRPRRPPQPLRPPQSTQSPFSAPPRGLDGIDLGATLPEIEAVLLAREDITAVRIVKGPGSDGRERLTLLEVDLESGRMLSAAFEIQDGADVVTHVRVYLESGSALSERLASYLEEFGEAHHREYGDQADHVWNATVAEGGRLIPLPGAQILLRVRNGASGPTVDLTRPGGYDG